MPTGSGLWHFLYRLVRKFIRSVASSEKNKWQLLQMTVTIYRLCVDGDMENAQVRRRFLMQTKLPNAKQ